VEESEVHLEQCARCLGCFVRTEDFSVLVAHEAAAEAPRMSTFIEPPAVGELPRQDLLAEAACPHCRVVMERARFAQKAAIVIDVCPKHGVWLDAGELPRLLEHVNQVARGDSRPDAADAADEQHWDRVLTQRLMEAQQVEAHLRHAESMQRSTRTRNVIIGTAVGGPWLGLFLAMRKGSKGR
jgi:Zn-finger nucleic acid-binding protein